MNLHEDFVKIHKELIECRSKLYSADKSEDKHLTVLNELNKLGVSISESLKDTEGITKRICNNANRFELDYDSHLHVGKYSVKPLVQVKQNATELFAGIKENDNKEFKENLNFDPLYNQLEQLERMNARHQEFMKYLKMSVDGLHDVFNNKGKQRFSGSDTVSSSSTNKTDPSTLGFSLFENSATNAATSSPLNN